MKRPVARSRGSARPLRPDPERARRVLEDAPDEIAERLAGSAKVRFRWWTKRPSRASSRSRPPPYVPTRRSPTGPRRASDSSMRDRGKGRAGRAGGAQRPVWRSSRSSPPPFVAIRGSRPRRRGARGPCSRARGVGVAQVVPEAEKGVARCSPSAATPESVPAQERAIGVLVQDQTMSCPSRRPGRAGRGGRWNFFLPRSSVFSPPPRVPIQRTRDRSLRREEMPSVARLRGTDGS